MNIQSSRRPIAPNPRTAAKPQAPTPKETQDTNSAFSVDRDLTYAVGATIAQIPRAIVGVTGPVYGVPQIAATAIGSVMAVAGAKEMMTNDSLHGRINGGIHLAVGAMSAAAPWTGDLAGSLYITSLAALGVKALIDQPGNIFKTAASETGSMLGEIFSPWGIDSKE